MLGVLRYKCIIEALFYSFILFNTQKARLRTSEEVLDCAFQSQHQARSKGLRSNTRHVLEFSSSIAQTNIGRAYPQNPQNTLLAAAIPIAK
jgi:hypothetical protein